MAQETPNHAHELALHVLKRGTEKGALPDKPALELAVAVLRQALSEGTLSYTQKALLEELVYFRTDVGDLLKTPSERRELSPEQTDILLGTLKTRFEVSENDELRKAMDFADVEKALRATPEKLYALHKLEGTGGEPQIVGIDGDEFVFEDRCTESPSGRRDLDFDQSLAQAEEFGADMQSPEAYKAMQENGEYDKETWSWLKTDPEYRERTGRALYGVRGGVVVDVFEHVAEYHSSDRGWRASLRVRKA